MASSGACRRDFLQVHWFSPLLQQLMVSANKKTPENKCDFNSAKSIAKLSLCQMWHTTCVACDLHTIAPWPLMRTCQR